MPCYKGWLLESSLSAALDAESRILMFVWSLVRPLAYALEVDDDEPQCKPPDTPMSSAFEETNLKNQQITASLRSEVPKYKVLGVSISRTVMMILTIHHCVVWRLGRFGRHEPSPAA